MLLSSALLTLMQAATSGGTSVPVVDSVTAPACVVIDVADVQKAPSLHVACGKVGVRLGHVDSYAASYNAELRSLLVATTDQGVRRIRLISVSKDGLPYVNDVTRELVQLSGGELNAALRTAASHATFALTGTVSIRIGDSAKLAVLDLRQYAIDAANSVNGTDHPALSSATSVDPKGGQ